MKRTERTVTIARFASDVRQDIIVEGVGYEEVITWADEHPVVYDIVTQGKSKAFGTSSCEYIGGARVPRSPEDILYRCGHIMRYATIGKASPQHGERGDFWKWRANFTLTHYKDKGFTGGFFQQFDGTYDRGCCSLDYTPATLPEVIERFRAWCGTTFKTVEIRIDKKAAWKAGAR